MRFRRTLNFHSLKKGRVRQTWNKHNLFNLTRVARTIPNFIKRTFFQQKWTAKALTRAYHGEHVKERKWERMFSKRLLSVVNMDPEYMAHHDGSEQAAGRGSGKDPYTDLDRMPWRNSDTVKNIQGSILERQDAFDERVAVTRDYGKSEMKNTQMSNAGQTPYMNMTYAPFERRIDVAVHRAMFASSTRQARQFVIHGAVKVNGQVMTHPSYLLNPGDMFQVDREFVLYATGKKKTSKSLQDPNAPSSGKAAKETEEAEAEPEEVAAADKDAAGGEAEAKAEEPAADPERTTKQLKFLSRLAKKVIEADKDTLKVRKKQRLRQFIKEARTTMSKLGRAGAGAETAAANVDLVTSINDMLKELTIQDPNAAAKAEEAGGFTAQEASDAKEAADAEKKAAAASAASAPPAPPPKAEPKDEDAKDGGKKKWSFTLTEKELASMKAELEDYHDNPWDPTKRYATPWQPRPYMSAFAFIPRYLEVNQNICAAVYLRHPVARRHYAEVPSPFPPNVMQLAFNWYLRRR